MIAKLLLLGFVLLLSVPVAAIAREDWWRVELGAESSLEVEIGRQRFEGTSDRRFDRDRFEERVGIEAQGFLFRPGVLQFRLNSDFGLRQQTLDLTGAGRERDSGHAVEYDAMTNLFTTLPVSLSLYGSRAEGRSSRSFGGEIDTTNEARGATLSFSNRFFPANLIHRRLRTSNESVGITFGGRREEERTLTEFTGAHETDVFQLRLRFRDEDVDDHSFPAVADYQLREAETSIGLNGGSYFEHRLRTRVRATRRTGDFERDTFSTDSNYLWQVSDDLDLELRYRFDRFDSARRTTENQNGSVVLRHWFYDSIRSHLQFSANRNAQQKGLLQDRGVSATVKYTKRLLWGTRFSSSFRFQYRVRDNDLDDSALAIKETLTVDDYLVEALLENRRIDPTTVVVLSSSGTRLLEGFDYRLVQVGDRLSVELLPESGLETPQRLSVDYEYEDAPSGRFVVRRLGVRTSWESTWFAVHYDHSRSDEDLLDGAAAGLLRDSRRDTFGFEFRGRTASLRARVGAQLVRRRAQTIDRDEWALTQRLTWQAGRRLVIDLNMRESSTDLAGSDGVLSDRTTAIIAGNASMVWQRSARQRLRMFVDYRGFEDSRAGDQTWLGIGARASVEFGRIEILPTLRWDLRERGSTRVTDLRGLLRVVVTL